MRVLLFMLGGLVMGWGIGFWTCLWVVYRKTVLDDDLSELDSELNEFTRIRNVSKVSEGIVKGGPERVNDNDLFKELHESDKSVEELES